MMRAARPVRRIRSAVAGELDRLTFRLGVAAIAIVGAAVVLDLSTWLFPYHSLNHDEAVYLQQAAMLLEGQLYLWPPVEDVLRPWFFVEDGDRLYPKYAPVPAAMFAAGRLAGGYRLTLAAVAAGNLALVAGIAASVFDRRTGLVAALLVLGSPLFLLDSAVFLPYAPTTFLNLTFAYAYIRADRTGDARLAVVAGIGIALAFFARPYTAVLFASPFVVHALWTLWSDPEGAFARQAATGALGLAGVAAAFGYNAVMTGSPWLFPYEAFAPLDGLGFGRRAILGHAVDYTVDLALAANGRVVTLLLTEWVAGGFAGTLLAVTGLGLAARRGRDPYVAVLAGLFVSVVVGNVLFWGNLNLLGGLDRPGDGLVAVLGPYYHFDLLLPIAAFGARGGIGLLERTRRAAHDTIGHGAALPTVVVVLVVVTASLGAVTVADLDQRIEANAEATETFDAAYEPFRGGPPSNSVILLPTPYGDWLNHPFQPLRNEPGFDGRAVYAIDERPFAIADAFPDRRLYRYGYRGSWAPFAESPREARLQRVSEVAGRRVDLETSLGVPDGAIGVTASVATADGRADFVAPRVSDRFDLGLSIQDGRVSVDGDVRAVGDETIGVSGREDLRLTVFVDFPGGGGLTYRLDLPVVVADDNVRALTPRVEWCRDARACGGSATYIEETAPEGISVDVTLSATEHNP